MTRSSYILSNHQSKLKTRAFRARVLGEVEDAQHELLAGLQFLVYVFFVVENWSEELQARQEFMLSILHLAQKLEVSFAFPTQSLYIEQGPQ